MAKSANEAHEEDIDDRVPHDPACLTKHEGGRNPKRGDGIMCSHRWQAYEQMCGDPQLYNWPVYDALCAHNRTSRVRTGRYRADSGQMWPPGYSTYLDPPETGEWDVGKGNPDNNDPNNFWIRSFDPYWHQAHHIVPNGSLCNAMAFDDGKYTVVIRRGLAGEGYNMNDKKNMIMLPMGKRISDTIGLPRHLKTPSDKQHWQYSINVQDKLEEIFVPLADRIKQHKNREYDEMKDQIEELSVSLYGQIQISTAPSLEDMPVSAFDF